MLIYVFSHFRGAMPLRCPRSFRPICLIVTAATISGIAVAQDWYNLEAVTPHTLMIGQYKRADLAKVDASDLIIPPEYQGQRDPLNTIFRTPQDFKLLLLQNGYAELKDEAVASDAYKHAQDLAKAARAGLWLDRLGPLPRTTESKPPIVVAPPPAMSVPAPPGYFQGLSDWANAHGVFLFQVLALAGVGTFLGNLALRRYYTRNPRLLFLGESLAGKTAISRMLLNPDAPEEEIFAIDPSLAKTQSRPTEPIQIGPLNVHPIYIDMVGTKYGEMLDEFLRRSWFGMRPRCAVLFVLAPTKGSAAASPDHEFIDIQYGVIKAQLEAALTSKVVRKPGSAILFLNKFDLFSELPPQDTKARKEKEEFLKLFARHIENIKNAAGTMPIRVIVGSAARNWGIHELRESIATSYRSKK